MLTSQYKSSTVTYTDEFRSASLQVCEYPFIDPIYHQSVSLGIIVDHPFRGYLNPKRLLSQHGKPFSQWKKRKYVKTYLTHFGSYGVLPYIVTTGSKDLKGTYLHYLLAIDLAFWISEELGDKLSQSFKELGYIQNDNVTPPPKGIKNSQPEKRVQELLHNYLGGNREVRVPEINGYIDILTDQFLVEVKADDWKKALGQVLVYGHYYPKHNRVIYLFDPKQGFNQDQVSSICLKHGVTLVVQTGSEVVPEVFETIKSELPLPQTDFELHQSNTVIPDWLRVVGSITALFLYTFGITYLARC